MMAGPAEALAAMQRWLQTGPELAQVTAVELRDCEDPGETAFEIRY
jgi:acylphosphatase